MRRHFNLTKIYPLVQSEFDKRLAACTEHDPVALKQIRQGFLAELNALKTNAEWAEFTIAFYGDVGCGKSSIIEALRIVLAEAAKQEERQAFVASSQASTLTLAGYQKALRARNATRQELMAFQTELGVVEHQAKVAELNATEQRQALRQKLAQKLDNAAIWNKLRYRLRPPPEKQQLLEMAKRWKNERVTERRRIIKMREQLPALHDQSAVTEIVLAQFTRKRDAQKKICDGNIIGDGGKPQTTQPQFYHFATRWGRFRITDLGGTGLPSQLAAIQNLQALRQAHAVFYVVNDAIMPTPAALEKLRRHLNDQTEIRLIVNWQANTLAQWKKRLESPKIQNRLQALDSMMRQQFGEHYQGMLTIAAKPAFFSVAACLPPFGNEEQQQQHFLSQHTPEELMALSGLNTLVQTLCNKMLHNASAKVRKTNIHKADCLLRNAIIALSSARHDQQPQVA